MNQLLLTLCLTATCSTSAYRLRRSHFTKTAITFPHDDPYSCSTPYRQPGVCVPIEACPELRRVSLRRLSKFLCGFEAGDVPLLCCERQTPLPTSVNPPLLVTPPSGTIPLTTTGLSRPQSVPPIPLLCSVSIHQGRRLKSCWFLALQRVVYPESGDEPIQPDALASIDDSVATPNATPGAANSSPRPIGDVKPSKTSVTSD